MNHPCENYCPHFISEPCAECNVLPEQMQLDTLGDDEHIENHVSPLCIVGGDV